MKMSCRDDETLPLTGFSEEFSVDVTVDEDFIPTSQPHSIISKVSKIAESPLKPEEDRTQSLSGFVDDTLPPEVLLQETQDKSIDFIPDTETKKRKIDYSNPVACKKKLQVFGTEDIFASSWEKDRVFENHLMELQTNSILYDSPLKMDSPSLKPEGSVTEIIVNDSAETVQLEDTPVKCEKLGAVEKFENSSFTMDRCEETPVFDNSVLLLEQPGTSGESKVSQKMYLNETIDDKFQAEDKPDLKVPDEIIGNEKQNGVVDIKNQPPLKLASNTVDNHSVVIRKVDFKLTVSCLLTINSKTKEILKKTVLNVIEQPKPKSSPVYNEPPTDYTSDKSKRCSTSSSGSVYSDKNGLPFALPKRISAVSDQTCTSDSSEENGSKNYLHDRMNLERIPWSNEYLFALKMDDIIKRQTDIPDWINKPNIISPKKPKNMLRNDLKHLGHISENTSSGGTLNCGSDDSCTEKTSYKNAESTEIDENKSMSEVTKASFSATGEEEVENKKTESKEKDSDDKVENVEVAKEKEKEKQSSAEGPRDVHLCDGLKVFARWTDKQYYSGVLSGQGKNDKWDVLFDDGTLKAIKQDFILPTVWLKIGMLVFALVDDNYESGQITEVKWGEKPTYIVQLDNGEGDVSVELSDLCLSDDMCSIVKENYRPIGIESPRGKADINCDNVVSGKRVREYRTPLRPPIRRVESSGSKKKPKGRDSERIKETPKKKSERKGALKTENGHLVEDKDPSAESPSGNETGETPLRSNGKEARGKAKPRSLTYEQEERQKKRKQNNWLNADGTPIPGPSGVKFRKKKDSAEDGFETMSSSPQPAERSRRKRKAEAEKGETPNTETEVKPTRGRRK